MKEWKRWGPPPLVMFILIAGFILARVDSPGLTFDEGMILESVDRFFAWMSGDISSADVWLGRERPSPAKLLAALGVAAIGETKFGVRFFAGILYSAASTCVYAALRKPHGAIAALAAVVCLVNSPPLSAFSTYASIESVLVSLTLLSLCFALKARTTKDWVVCGLVSGIAVGTKISGIIAPVTIVAWQVAACGKPTISSRYRVAFLIAVAAGFLATWPHLILDPSAMITHLRDFEQAPREPTLFFGPTIAPDWRYLPVWLAIGIPPLMTIAACAGIAGKGPMTAIFRIFFVVGSTCGLLAHGYLREGLRHILPLCSAVAVLGGIGAGRFSRIRPGLGGFFLVALFVSASGAMLARRASASLYVNGAAGGMDFAMSQGLPIVSSGDVLKNEVLSALPDGRYSVIPGRFSDRPLDFANERWRKFMAGEAAAIGRRIEFVESSRSERILVLGSGRLPAEAIGEVTVAVDGSATLVSFRSNPNMARNGSQMP